MTTTTTNTPKQAKPKGCICNRPDGECQVTCPAAPKPRRGSLRAVPDHPKEKGKTTGEARPFPLGRSHSAKDNLDIVQHDEAPVQKAASVSDRPKTKHEVLMTTYAQVENIVSLAEDDLKQRKDTLKLTAEFEAVVYAKESLKVALQQFRALGREMSAAWRSDPYQLMMPLDMPAQAVAPKPNICGNCHERIGTIPQGDGIDWCVKCFQSGPESSTVAEPPEHPIEEIDGDDVDDDESFEDDIEEDSVETITDETGYAPVVKAFLNLLEEESNDTVWSDVEILARTAADEASLVKGLAKIAKRNGYKISSTAPFAERVSA